MQEIDYIKNKLSDIDPDQQQGNISIEKMSVEIDGCEIRTARIVIVEDSTQTTPVYNNGKKAIIIKLRDVRLSFVRLLDLKSKT